MHGAEKLSRTLCCFWLAAGNGETACKPPGTGFTMRSRQSSGLCWRCWRPFSSANTRLARGVGSSHQNVKQLVLKLQQKGYVALAQDGRDAREPRCTEPQSARSCRKKHGARQQEFMRALYAHPCRRGLNRLPECWPYAAKPGEDANGGGGLEWKTLVVYTVPHYGSTRRYAQWLAQALDADAAEERQADARLCRTMNA